MSDEQPQRQRPGRKPGQGNGPANHHMGFSMQPGATPETAVVKIGLELPVPVAITLLQAAAQAQQQANKPGTHWQALGAPDDK